MKFRFCCRLLEFVPNISKLGVSSALEMAGESSSIAVLPGATSPLSLLPPGASMVRLDQLGKRQTMWCQVHWLGVFNRPNVACLPIVAACAGEKSVSVEESALYFHIVFVEEPITAAEYKILYDRTRLTLQVELVHAQPPGSIPPPPRPRQEVHDGRVAGSKTRCWLYGRHSQDLARLGGRRGDRILLLAPKVNMVYPNVK